jgi:glutamate N-acetyltransferase/amino-acid N-acetyltransferase
MKRYNTAILPACFQAHGLACGIKKSGKLDLGLLYSEIPARASCLFTANKIKAAPIKLNQRYLKAGRVFGAVIINSGNANCYTGVQGLKDAEATAESLGKAIGLESNKILVASTGVIGKRLPLGKIKAAIPQLVQGLSRSGIHRAKKAILTTDTFVKECTVSLCLGSLPVTVCGIAKGAGMIAPDMATMLCFILTDANITQTALDKALGLAVENSFNCISVDGCMSTNDAVMLLANGASGNKLINSGENFSLFSQALNTVCLELAKLIVRDAEGATKFIRIKVRQAVSYPQAKKAALAIANSNLFKTAIYGENPNFGRIVASVGACGVRVREEDIRIKVSPLHKKDIFVDVALKQGKASATVYTADLTPEYVKINAEYN